MTHNFRVDVFVSKMDVFGWRRGGLQGAGSGIVGVGEEIVSWDDPMGLPDVGSVGDGFYPDKALRWRMWGAWAVFISGVDVLIPGVDCCVLTSHRRPRDINGRKESGTLACELLSLQGCLDDLVP